jgi:hypothetical protein
VCQEDRTDKNLFLLGFITVPVGFTIRAAIGSNHGRTSHSTDNSGFIGGLIGMMLGTFPLIIAMLNGTITCHERMKIKDNYNLFDIKVREHQKAFNRLNMFNSTQKMSRYLDDKYPIKKPEKSED